MYRLAAHHRIPDVEEYKQRLTVRQLQKWIAYHRIEPFGEDWLRTARLCFFVVSALGAKVDADFIDKFLPTYDPDRPMTEDEIKAELAKFSRMVK